MGTVPFSSSMLSTPSLPHSPHCSRATEDLPEVRSIINCREMQKNDPNVEKQVYTYSVESVIEGQTFDYLFSLWPHDGYCLSNHDTNSLNSYLSHEEASPENHSKAASGNRSIVCAVRPLLAAYMTKYKQYERKLLNDVLVQQPQGIFGVPLRQSIVYANVAISLVDSRGKSYIYGYVPIVVAKCGVFLKEKGT